MKKIGKLTIIICISLMLTNVANAITNGEPDGDGHPYVCLVVAFPDVGLPSVGSGSLISPYIVLTAGHITSGTTSALVWIDEIPPTPPSTVGGLTGTPITHPDYSITGDPQLPDWITHDVGIIVLDEPVYLDEYAMLPAEGYVDTLAMKTWVDQVGYGYTYQEVGNGPPTWEGALERMYAPAQLITSKHKWSDEFIKTTANPAQGKGGTCFGDSGGPVLDGGTNIIIGVTSWGLDSNCKGPSYSSRVDTSDILDWINSYL